jgi:hypothetical protein
MKMSKPNSTSFVDEGFLSFPRLIPGNDLTQILADVCKTRTISQCFTDELFTTEEKYLASPKQMRTNPGPGYNLTEKIDLDAIENNDNFVAAVESVLGKDYAILHKKFVVGVPDHWMPEWVKNRVKGVHAKNVGAFIKKKYRDVTYFNGINFHQDVLDYSGDKARPDSFLTVYVYFETVTEHHSPLYVVPRSHKFGATIFPHDLEMNTDKQELFYSDRLGQSGVFKYHVLTGEAGDVNMWHALTLHGTRPTSSSIPRVSLRYMIEKNYANESTDTIIDRTNATISGPLAIIDRPKRSDTDQKGSFIGVNKSSVLHR